MHTFKTLSKNGNSKLAWTLAHIMIFVGLLFSFLALSEFYEVKIKGNTGAYPWGPVNDNPWYYQTPAVYSSYSLITGLLFLMTTLLTAWATIRKNKKLLIVAVCLMLFFLLAVLISAAG